MNYLGGFNLKNNKLDEYIEKGEKQLSAQGIKLNSENKTSLKVLDKEEIYMYIGFIHAFWILGLVIGFFRFIPIMEETRGKGVNFLEVSLSCLSFGYKWTSFIYLFFISCNLIYLFMRKIHHMLYDILCKYFLKEER